ncbi:unnamed protein product [Absidia cylindrospora]
MSKLFTYEQVAEHNKREDLWMIIDNKVYDITEFVDEHPGGEEVLIDEGARDATGPFEDVGHSPDAREMLVKYYLGDVDANSAPVKVVSANANDTTGDRPEGNPLRIIIPVVIILAYIYFRFYA